MASADFAHAQSLCLEATRGYRSFCFRVVWYQVCTGNVGFLSIAWAQLALKFMLHYDWAEYTDASGSSGKMVLQLASQRIFASKAGELSFANLWLVL